MVFGKIKKDHIVPAQSIIPTKTALAMGGYYLISLGIARSNLPVGGAILLLGIILFIRPLAFVLKKTLWKTWIQLEETRLEHQRSEQANSTSLIKPAIIVMPTVAVSLTLMEYFGDRAKFFDLAGKRLPSLVKSDYWVLYSHAYWCIFRLFNYVIFPLGVSGLLMKKDLKKNFGLVGKDHSRH